MKEKQKLILLYSGGLDSTLLLEMALKMGYQVYCILVNYKQLHAKELDNAEKYLRNKKISFALINVEGLDVDSVLKNGVKKYTGVSEFHVPSRNMMFISFAASYAEHLGVNLIWYGANMADRNALFPDCYQEWIYAMNQVLKINGSFPIKLEAPLIGMDKDTIRNLAKTYNINEEEVFSGYGLIKAE